MIGQGHDLRDAVWLVADDLARTHAEERKLNQRQLDSVISEYDKLAILRLEEELRKRITSIDRTDWQRQVDEMQRTRGLTDNNVQQANFLGISGDVMEATKRWQEQA